jgi:hypothetical protein
MTDLVKPIKRIARGLSVPHGIKPDLVITIYPGGIVGIKEHSRSMRSEIQYSASALYEQGVISQQRKRLTRCKEHRRRRCTKCIPR